MDPDTDSIVYDLDSALAADPRTVDHGPLFAGGPNVLSNPDIPPGTAYLVPRGLQATFYPPRRRAAPAADTVIDTPSPLADDDGDR